MAQKKQVKAKAKSQSKLSRFFSNRRNVVLSVFVLGFAVVGSYYVYRSSAYTIAPKKSSSNVSDCYVTIVKSGPKYYPKYGSRGPCVPVLKKSLNAIAKDNVNFPTARWSPVGDTWFNDYYDAQLMEAVKGYQKLRGLSVDGTVGPATWAALNTDCKKFPSIRTACGL